MIKINLAEIMAKNKIRTIQKISDQTGISRTTLTALYYGTSTGIQFSTLDRLCQFFNCHIDELINITDNAE